MFLKPIKHSVSPIRFCSFYFASPVSSDSTKRIQSHKTKISKTSQISSSRFFCRSQTNYFNIKVPAGKSSSPKLPSQITNLLKAKKKEPGFPHLQRISGLASKIYESGLDINSLESYLVKLHSPNRPKKDFYHYSRHALKYWKNGMENKGFQKMVELYHGLETSGKDQLPIKRVEYFLTIFRFAVILQDACQANRTDILKQAEDLCSQAVEKYDNFDLPVIYFLTLVRTTNELEQNVERAQRLFKKHSNIEVYLDKEVWKLTSQYLPKHMLKIENDSLYQELPIIFKSDGYELFLDNLEKALSFDEILRQKVLAFKSLALWNSGQFSQSLIIAAGCLEFWLKHLDSNVDSRTNLGLPMIRSLSIIMKNSVAKEMKPAMEFLELMCSKLSEMFKTPYPWYFYWIQLYKSEREEHQLKAEEILKSFPDLKELRDLKMENSVTNSSITNETANYFIGEFLKNLKIIECREELQHDRESKTLFTSQKQPSLSKTVKTEMLDIEILEHLKANHLEEAIAVLSNENGKGGVSVSDEVLESLIQSALKDKQSHNLFGLLKNSLPLQTSSVERVFQVELDFKLKICHADWQRGDHVTSIKEVIHLYKTLLEEEFHIRNEKLALFLTKVKNYLRLFLEESFLNGFEDEILEIVKLEGLAISDTFGDFDVSVLYWESLFFSPTFKVQIAAEEFLNDYPRVPHHIDVDHILARVHKLKNESRLRKLLEICLKFDLGDYEKTRAFEGLLVFQCEKGNFQEATNTLGSAHSLGITIGADAVHIYNDLKDDLKTSSNSGIFSAISDMFRNKEK